MSWLDGLRARKALAIAVLVLAVTCTYQVIDSAVQGARDNDPMSYWMGVVGLVAFIVILLYVALRLLRTPRS